MLKFILFILIAFLYLILPKNNTTIGFIKLKKHIFMIILLIIVISLICFSNSCYLVAKDAFMLWVNSVIPSLLPFFICIDLLKNTAFINIIGKILTPIMHPIFNVPGAGAFAVAMGITSGYPTGAKISSELYSSNECSKIESERLLSFTNTSGPLFIVSAVGSGMFKNPQIGLLLLLTHFLASLTVGLIFRNYKSSHKNTSSVIIPQKLGKINKTSKISTNNYKNNTLISQNPNNSSKNKKYSPDLLNSKNIGLYMGNAIQNSISTLLLIGGYIVFFAVLGNILEKLHIIQFLSLGLSPLLKLLQFPNEAAVAIVKGILEVTSGIRDLSNLIGNENEIIILAAFLLGFGGLSVLMQTASIISNTNLSLKPYISGKVLHGVIAAFYTHLILKYSKFMSLEVVTSFSYSNISNPIITETSNLITILSTLLLLGILINTIFRLKRKNVYIKN